jgi:hypothetical protein
MFSVVSRSGMINPQKRETPKRKQDDTSLRPDGETPRQRSTQRSRDLPATQPSDSFYGSSI